MNSKTLFRGAFIALCLVGMLVLPAAAAQNGQASAMSGSTADQGLKDELYANHQLYRLQRFDMNVEQATGILAILDTYGIDTTSSKNTLTTISGKRSGLEAALDARDPTNLKTINAGLKNLWKQFRTDIRDALRAHNGGRAAATTLFPLDSTEDTQDTVL